MTEAASAEEWYLQCPRCRYDIGWQREGAVVVCPECGRWWTRAAIEQEIVGWERYWRRVLVWPPFIAPVFFAAMWWSDRPREDLIYWLVFTWVVFSWGAACVILTEHRWTGWLLALLFALPLALLWTSFSHLAGTCVMPQMSRGI